MIHSLRKTINLKDGVKVETLFTPHLYCFKGRDGVDFICEQTPNGVFELYADVIFCAAINAFVLDGKGSPEDFPYTRGDFHEWMVLRQQEFGETMNFALIALTGKSMKDFAAESAKTDKTKPEKKEEEDKKKTSASIIVKWRHFLLGIAGKRNGKPR